MKVGFDISQLAFNGGVPVYTRNLAQELIKDNRLKMIFFYSSLRTDYKGQLPNVRQYKIPLSLLEFSMNRLRFPKIETFIGDIDIYHSSDWIQAPSVAKRITTYHDVIPLKYPQWSHPKIVEVHKRRLKLVENEIDLVIAVSQSTKTDLIKISKIPAEKIVVIYEGVGQEFQAQQEKEVQHFKEKYHLPDQFVLSLGGVGERKNLGRIKQACSDFPLVITGKTIPWIDEKELPLLFSSANLLLYPSLYEGFGLPILEAFACGTPVITSNISAMPEVGGKAAIYVDPTNIADIKDKIKLLMEDNQLRKELVNKGFEQVKKFTWEQSARKTAESYQQMLN